VTYVDSSALVPLYVPERFSKAARSLIRSIKQVPFTALHRLEVANAFEQLVGRGLITRDECQAIAQQVQDDIDGQRLTPRALDLDRVFVEAGDLSRLYSAKFLARSLDLLHVAAAHIVGCARFGSADDRQLAVAKASGLLVVDIKRPTRRRSASHR
jgi:predicted nucleic acid-binding protein